MVAERYTACSIQHAASSVQHAASSVVNLLIQRDDDGAIFGGGREGNIMGFA